MLRSFHLNFPNRTFQNKSMTQFPISEPKGISSHSSIELLLNVNDNAKDVKIQGISSYSCSSNDSLNSSLNSFSSEDYRQSQDSQFGKKKYLSQVENVNKDLSKTHHVEKELKEDMLSLYSKNPKEFLVLEVLNILVPTLPRYYDPPLTMKSILS